VGDTEITLPAVAAIDPATVSFAWPNRYAEAYFSYALGASRWSPVIRVERSDRTETPAGAYDIALNMETYVENSYQYTSATVNRTIEAVQSENTEVTVGDKFTGVLSRNGSGVVTGRSDVYMSMNNIVDEYGNKLSYYTTNVEENALVGVAKFTNKLDSTDAVEVALSGAFDYFHSGNSFRVTVPNVTGEYYYAVTLSTDRSILPDDGGNDDNEAIDDEDIDDNNNPSPPYYPPSYYPSTGGDAATPTARSEDEAKPTQTPVDTITKAPATENGINATLTKSRTYFDGLFSDVTQDAWYSDTVKFVYEYGVMNGESATRFSPNNNTTRAQMITILARLSGLDTDGGETWYDKAVEWAKQNSISDGANLSDNVTREQLVTMLWRFAGEPKVDVAIDFTDAGEVSAWAVEAVKWAVSIGLLRGYADGSVKPGATATRAEVATLIERYMKN
jgi:hypothetical protein